MANPDIKPTSYVTTGDGKIRTTFTDGTVIEVNPRTYQIGTDTGGQVAAYRPAIYTKPKGILAPLQRAWNGFLGLPGSRQTTEQGASSAGSPVTFYLTLWEQLFGRRARIEDTRSLYLSDARVFRSTNMYVDEALRGGPKIRVQGKDRKSKQAQKIAKEVEKVFNPSLIQEWGKGLIIEGDLFIQHVAEVRSGKKKLIKAKAMPGVGMQRIVDDADEFIFPDTKAFEQIDSMTFETVAEFPSSLMTHTRWSKVNGDQYGTSELCTARRIIRQLELMEQAVMINRMVRAPIRRFHSVGSPDNTGSAQEILNYKNENLFYNGKLEAFNPLTTMVDYVGNGNTKVETLSGDSTLGEVKDLVYIQGVLMCALPTPGPFFGLQIEEAKRDVLEDMKSLWVRSHEKLQNAIGESVCHGFELALTFANIDPETIEYNLQWSATGLESNAEVIDYLTTAKEAGLMSEKTGVQKIAQITGVTDIEQELADIKATADTAHSQDIEKRTAGSSMKEKMDDEEGAKPEKKASKPKQSVA